MDYNGDTPEDVTANAAFFALYQADTISGRQAQIASDYFHSGWEAAMAFAKSEVPEGCTPTDAKVLRAANHKLASEVEHWKSNHADQVTRCALLRQREDLPVDRIPAYKELVRLQDENAELRNLMSKSAAKR